MHYQLGSYNWVKARAQWIHRRSTEQTFEQVCRREARIAELIASGVEIPFSAECPSGVSLYLDANKFRYKISLIIGLPSQSKIGFLDSKNWPKKGTWNKWQYQHHYQIRSTSLYIATYCAIDLCDRLLEVFRIEAIPVILRVGKDAKVDQAKYKAYFGKLLESVNGGQWDFDQAIDIAIKKATAHQLASGHDGESRFADYLRHKWTPYDYCWQTNKLSFVDADANYQPIIKHFKELSEST
jgi:hypothetical protein